MSLNPYLHQSTFLPVATCFYDDGDRDPPWTYAALVVAESIAMVERHAIDAAPCAMR